MCLFGVERKKKKWGRKKIETKKRNSICYLYIKSLQSTTKKKLFLYSTIALLVLFCCVLVVSLVKLIFCDAVNKVM